MNVAMYVTVQFSSLLDPGRMEVSEISGVNQCIYSFFITLTSTDFKFTQFSIQILSQIGSFAVFR